MSKYFLKLILVIGVSNFVCQSTSFAFGYYGDPCKLQKIFLEINHTNFENCVGDQGSDESIKLLSQKCSVQLNDYTQSIVNLRICIDNNQLLKRSRSKEE